MIKISKKAQYGLRAMVCLAKSHKSKKVLSTKTISKIEGIPFEFLEKIILQLEKARLVKGIRGVSGGYIIAKSPREINVNDVVSVLENKPKNGNKPVVDCSFCQRKKGCLTRDVWARVDFALAKTLSSITLSNLIKK
jgi:Rrf2 family protein